MIEARGARDVYVYFIKARKVEGPTINSTQASMLDVADSEDEAYGRAMRAAAIAFPSKNGWRDHYALPHKLSGIDWVGRHDFSKITPQP